MGEIAGNWKQARLNTTANAELTISLQNFSWAE